MSLVKPLHPTQTRLLVFSVQYCILLTLVVASVVEDQLGWEAEYLINPLCFSLLGVTLWSFWSWFLVTGQLFTPYTLFLLSTILFNGGQGLLEVFQLNKQGILDGQFSAETLLKTLFLVLLSFVCFHLGGLLSTLTVKEPAPLAPERLQAQRQDVRRVGQFLLAVSFLPALFVLREGVVAVLSYGYALLYQGAGAAGTGGSALRILGLFLVPAALFLLTGSQENTKDRAIATGLIVTYCLTYLFLGERNRAILPLIAFAWLWHRLIKPIQGKYLLGAGAFVGFVVFPVIREVRNSAGGDRFSLDSLINTFMNMQDNPAISTIAEMGGSMITVAFTLDLVPASQDFHWGADYFFALLTLLPNIFGGDVHPAVARGTVSYWLLAQVNPFAIERNIGLGFSYIAEAYLNFGWIGSAIALTGMGFLYGRLILWATLSKDPAKFSAVASFTAFFLFYARAETLLIVRPLVWYSLLPYLGVWISRRLRERQSG